MKKKRTVMRVKAHELRALSSPLRIEIVGLFQAHGPMAIRELADKLSRTADGLYHHVRILLSAGVLKVAAVRRIGKRDESVYELTAKRFGIEPSIESPEAMQAIVESAESALRLGAREFRRALEATGSQCNHSKTPSIHPKLSRQKSWLTRADYRELQRLLDQIESFLQARVNQKRGTPVSLTTLLTPLTPKTGPKKGPIQTSD